MASRVFENSPKQLPGYFRCLKREEDKLKASLLEVYAARLQQAQKLVDKARHIQSDSEQLRRVIEFYRYEDAALTYMELIQISGLKLCYCRNKSHPL